jgi:hypothetical protein
LGSALIERRLRVWLFLLARLVIDYLMVAGRDGALRRPQHRAGFEVLLSLVVVTRLAGSVA